MESRGFSSVKKGLFQEFKFSQCYKKRRNRVTDGVTFDGCSVWGIKSGNFISR